MNRFALIAATGVLTLVLMGCEQGNRPVGTTTDSTTTTTTTQPDMNTMQTTPTNPNQPMGGVNPDQTQNQNH